jgi:hypothetical protein
LPIAFYIEYPRITAIEVTGSAKKPKLKRVVVGDLPEPRNEDGTPIADKQGYLNAQIAAFVKEHKLTGGKHYLLAGPDAMRFRDMTLAFKDKRQIDRVLQFQVEGVIPNIPIEQLTIGYNILMDTPDGARLLVHAADKDYIRQRIIALEEAGCSVEAVDSHLSGTLNLGLMHPALAAGTPPALWIDFAGTTAAISIVNDGRVQSARVFMAPYLAGATGVTATAENAKAQAKQAQAEAEQRGRALDPLEDPDFDPTEEGMEEEYVMLEQAQLDASATLPKSESVNIGEEQVADRIRHMSKDELLKFINRVSIEARRTMLMTHLDAEPARLVVSGLGNAGGTLADLLGNELQLTDAQAIELMDVVNPRDDREPVKTPDVGELSYLTGCALKGLGRDYTGIDFRYGDLAPGTLFDYAKTPLAFTATLVLLFCGILFLISWTHARQYERDIAALRDGHEGHGPEYYFKAAFFYTKAKDKDSKGADDISKPTPALLKLRQYPSNPEDPAAEIRAAHKKLKDTQTILQGQVKEDYAKPHPADQIMAAVLKTIEGAVPSYDFALLKVDILESGVTIEYMASITEDQAERDKLLGSMPKEKQEAARGPLKMKESDRMFDAFRKLVAEHADWFEGAPVQTEASRAQEGPEGRKADQMTIKLQMKKVEPPKKKSTKGAK